jgi:hypothetical protein
MLPITSYSKLRLASNRKRRSRRSTDVSRDPFNFLENNPIQSSFWVRFMCPKTRRNWLRLPIVRFPSGVELPPSSRPEAKPHPRPRPPPFPRDSCVSWHTVNLRGAHLAPIIRTSEHFHVFSLPPHLSVRMFGSGVKKRANSPRLSPRRNAPLVAAASRRSRGGSGAFSIADPELGIAR